MLVHVSCPHCDFVIERAADGAPPTHCPACGARISCPRCGSLLRREPGSATESGTHCPSCRVSLEGTATGAADTDLPIAGDAAVHVPGFEVQAELGRGGMGIVYHARQLSLSRDVALKVLPPVLAADPDRLERFRNEAALAAGLIGAHILPVFDVRQVQGVPVIVMPLIEGTDLGRIVRDRRAVREGRPAKDAHPWAGLDDRAYLDLVLPLLDKVVGAVVMLHGRGILHRDIKPSNVLVDAGGQPWLSDFGLARLEQKGVGTQAGVGMGTPGYMSPEQAAGTVRADARSDVFSLGATLYHTLTLELPYGKAVVPGPATPAAPHARQPLLPADLDRVLLKALAPDRGRRYASAAELQADWLRVRQGQPQAAASAAAGLAARARRRPVTTAVSLSGLLGIIAAAVFWGVHRAQPEPGGAGTAPAGVRRTILVETEPPGARVALVPLDPDYGFPLCDPDANRFAERLPVVRPEGWTPMTVPDVPPGDYLVVADIPGFGFHEVYRVVPEQGEMASAQHPQRRWDLLPDGRVRLPVINIPAAVVTQGMARFDGGMLEMGGVSQLPKYRHTVAPFFLDATEVTEQAYRAVVKASAPPYPGSKLPAAGVAAAGVPYDWAVDYAEQVGKRLLDQAEYEFAATNGGRTRYPWGNDGSLIHGWPLGPVGEPAYDHTPTKPPVFGLFSNVGEWTSSANVIYVGKKADEVTQYNGRRFRSIFGASRVVRGAPPPVLHGTLGLALGGPTSAGWDPRIGYGYTKDQALPGLGFRCARSARARFLDP